MDKRIGSYFFPEISQYCLVARFQIPAKPEDEFTLLSLLQAIAGF
jgi:hypothetical protein